MVQLGLATKDTLVPTFQAGKIIETVALGLMATLLSTVLAVPLSFLAAHNIISRVRGGTLIYYAMRTLLNIVRAIDTMIWGVIVVVWVGLGPFAGVIALTIHSVAALGKLFSEEVEHIDPGPIEAVAATGANLIQTIRYAVIPQIVPPFLAFTLLRWDINMRSATIVGMVAGGGIGFYIVETLRKSAYPQYAAALWAIAIVIMIVDFISAKWRERIMVGDTKVNIGKPKLFYTSPRAWLYIVLGLLAFVYCWELSGIDFSKMLDPGPNFVSLVRGFLSFNLDPEVTDEVSREMMLTIFQALLATTLGAFAAIPFSFLAARNLTGRSRLSIWIYYLTRTMFNVLRSIEAILYVAIFFYWVSFGNFAGMLALAVTTFALIGKLFSEAIENIDPGPLEAILATGATRLQAIVYGILPQIIPPFISYAIYQWDINIRMATIVGFAGGGGIGFLLYTKYFPFMSYRSAGTAVALIVIVVTIMDFASAKIRERMV
jgi:phosphonate transport system permease protein